MRIVDGLKTMLARDEMPTLFGALKAIPFDGSGGGGMGLSTWPGWNGTGWGGYANSNVNYAAEIGDLGSSSLIMAAVNWLGTTLPEAPVQVLKQKSAKVFEPVPEHPLVDLLTHPTREYKGDSIQEWYAGELMWKAFAFSWVVDGNVYFRKVRNALGQVIQFWYEPHYTIRPRWRADGGDFISFYEVLRNGRWYEVKTEDVVHLRNSIDPTNPRLGLSPVASVLREIFTDGERARYSSLILKNGGVVPFVLSPDPTGGPATINAQEIKEEILYLTTGDSVGKPLVLSGAVKVQKLGLSPDEMLVEKASLIPEQRISAVVGIPAIVLGFGAGLERSTFSNFKEAREAAYESCVIPTQRLIAGELGAQLLPDFGDTKGLKIAHDLSMVRVLQDDRNLLFTREALAYEKGIKTRAEARSALGLDTKPEDDVFYVQAATEKAQEEPLAPLDTPPQLVNGKDKTEVVN